MGETGGTRLHVQYDLPSDGGATVRETRILEVDDTELMAAKPGSQIVCKVIATSKSITTYKTVGGSNA